MSDGPAFLDGEVEERAEERRNRDERFRESPVSFDGENIEDLAERLSHVAVPTPDELLPKGLGNRRDRRVGDTSSSLQELLQATNLNLDEISERIDGVNLEEMSDSGLLQVIAEMQINNFRLFQGMLTTQVSSLQAMVDTARAVEPPRAVTVSGTNSIEDASSPQPVVPQSDQTSIITRTLFIRAAEDNTSKVFIGDDDVAPDEGFMLKPGESWELPIDLRDDVYYMASESVGDTVQLLGVV